MHCRRNSVTLGELLEGTPTPTHLNAFLTGWTKDFGVALGLAGSFSWNSADSSINLGLGTPQIGLSRTFGAHVTHTDFGWGPKKPATNPPY